MRRRIRELLDRLGRWWTHVPGRHSLDYPAVLIARPITPRWALAEADEQLATALLRSMYPRLYMPADTYWAERYRDLGMWLARETAEWNTTRRECGLPPRPLPPLPVIPARLAAA